MSYVGVGMAVGWLVLSGFLLGIYLHMRVHAYRTGVGQQWLELANTLDEQVWESDLEEIGENAGVGDDDHE